MRRYVVRRYAVMECDHMKHGYAFESEIKHSLEMINSDYSMFVYKMVDTHSYDYNIFCPHCHQKFHNPFIAPKTIADYMVITDGKVYFLECKSSKNGNSFPLNNISDHQLRWGLSINTYDIARYMFLINDRRYRCNYRCYCIPVDMMDSLISEVYPRKSIPWEDIERVGIEIDNIGGGLWNVKKIFV